VELSQHRDVCGKNDLVPADESRAKM